MNDTQKDGTMNDTHNRTAQMAALQRRLTRLEQEVRIRKRVVVAGLALGILGLGALGLGSPQAYAVCTATLPAGMVTFCAGAPVKAAEMNKNFQRLVDEVTKKTGPWGSPVLTSTGSSTVETLKATGKITATEFVGSGAQLTTNTVPLGALVTEVQQSLCPVGTVVPYMGDVAPPGWVLCNGAAVLRLGTYAKLYGVVGNRFGQGDKQTTFNLPDFRGRFLRGTDLGAKRDPEALVRKSMAEGGAAGDLVGSVQLDEFKSHTHNYVAMLQTNGNDTSSELYERYGDYQKASSAAGGTETRPINANVNYIIKY